MAYTKQFQLHAGELRHRLTVQDYTETQGDIGQPIKTWTDTAKRWGKVLPVSSREIIEGNQIEGRATHRIVMRHLEGLTRESRVKFGTRFFNIENIINVEERNKVHLIVATEVT